MVASSFSRNPEPNWHSHQMRFRPKPLRHGGQIIIELLAMQLNLRIVIDLTSETLLCMLLPEPLPTKILILKFISVLCIYYIRSGRSGLRVLMWIKIQDTIWRQGWYVRCVLFQSETAALVLSLQPFFMVRKITSQYNIRALVAVTKAVILKTGLLLNTYVIRWRQSRQ